MIVIAERFSWLFARIGQSLGSRFCLYNVDQEQDKGCIGGFKITADGQPGTETYTISEIKSSDLGAVKYDAPQGSNVGDTFLSQVGIHGGGTVKMQIGEQPADLSPYPAALARVLTRQHTPQQWRGELRLEQKYTGGRCRVADKQRLARLRLLARGLRQAFLDETPSSIRPRRRRRRGFCERLHSRHRPAHLALYENDARAGGSLLANTHRRNMARTRVFRKHLRLRFHARKPARVSVGLLARWTLDSRGVRGV